MVATHLWVGAVTIGSGLYHCYGRNTKVCITVGPVTVTSGILTSSVKGAGFLTEPAIWLMSVMCKLNWV